jgi:hypothetical protein
MAYVAPKTVLNTFLAKVRAWPGEPLKSCVFRKGPQKALTLGASEDCACIIALNSLLGGEESAGSANNFYHSWQFAVALLVRDDEADPEAAEDLRLDLIEQFSQFMADIETRSMFGGAKRGRITECQLGYGQYFEDSDVIYRYAELGIEYRTLRSGTN